MATLGAASGPWGGRAVGLAFLSARRSRAPDRTLGRTRPVPSSSRPPPTSTPSSSGTGNPCTARPGSCGTPWPRSPAAPLMAVAYL